MPFTFHIVRKGAPIGADELTRLASRERCVSFEQTRPSSGPNPKTGEVVEISSRAPHFVYQTPDGEVLPFLLRSRSGELSLDCAPEAAKRLKQHVLHVAALLAATVEDDEGNPIS